MKIWSWNYCSLLYLVFVVVIFLSASLSVPSLALTDSHDLIALQDMYNALKKPEQLKGWKTYEGDPCEESWTGIECFGSSVIHIKLRGLELGGSLGSQLGNLHNLKILDVSLNKIEGAIPWDLPPNVTILNLSSNNFSLSLPYSLSTLGELRHLNLSHNAFAGVIGDVFIGLRNLREMDLSYNNFAGDLPSSFASLTNLTKLFLQNNQFTGSVVYLSNLQLTDLNIQENHFSGVIPQHFETIPNLWIASNKFHTAAEYPPWDFPFEKGPMEQNITSPPTADTSAIEKYPPRRVQGHQRKGMAPGGIVFVVGGVALFAGLVALAIALRIKQVQAGQIESRDNSPSSTWSVSVSSARGEMINEAHHSSGRHEEIPQIMPINSPPMVMTRSTPAARYVAKDRTSRRSYSRKCRIPLSAKVYAISDLQLATNNFSEVNLLGEGSLGSVFKAEFPDGQIFAVKNVNMVSLSFDEEEQFLDVVRYVSRLKHPNIVPLVGYCVEHGQHLLVYEYVRKLTLDEALHCEFFLPLTWGLRIQIAIGVARALDYMHSLLPPVAHCNLKAANILLDDELMPRLCDCGLSVLRPLTSNDVKLKASEMAISNAGYVAPEHGEPGVESTKTDVYAFGILLLELLTGKRPFDSSRPMEEQSLVKWASCRLHDGSSLEEMVDPGLRRSFTAKALSRYADIISLCVQPEKEFRPPMSQVVQALTSVMPKPGSDNSEVDTFERSFRSAYTRFVASPAMSYISV